MYHESNLKDWWHQNFSLRSNSVGSLKNLLQCESSIFFSTLITLSFLFDCYTHFLLSCIYYLFLYVKHTLDFGKHEWYWFSKVSSDAVIYSSPSWTDGWAMHDWTFSQRIKFESLKVRASVQLKVEAVNKSGSPDEMWTNFTGSLHLMNLDSPTLRTLATVPKIK